MSSSRLVDRIIALGVAALAVALLSVWSFTGLHPYVWDDTAIAAGLLPAKDVLPGFGLYLAHILFKIFPYSVALVAVQLFGKIFLAATVYLMYGIVSRMLLIVSTIGARDGRRRTLAIRVVSGVAAFLFACSDPVWHAAQSLTSSTFVIFEILLAIWLFTRFLVKASYSMAVATLCTLGFLSAETPLGFLLIAVFVFITFRVLRMGNNPSWADFLDPVRLQRTKWSMTFAFLGALIFGILCECAIFAGFDGLRAFASTAGDLPKLYVTSYVACLVGGTNLLGAILLVATAVVPVVLVFILIVPATDEERYLSFRDSIVYFLVGLLAFIQLSPFAILWFWNMPSVVVSRVALLFGAFLDAIALAWALFVLAVEIFCRDYHHIEDVLFQNEREAEEDDEGEPWKSKARNTEGELEEVESVRLTPGRLGMLLLPILLVVISLFGRRLIEDRRLQGVIHAFVGETILEAGNARYLFTDGSYDSYIRLEAKRRGSLVIPVSVMGGDNPRDAYLRSLGTAGFEDRLTLEAGAAEAIRTWILSKSEKTGEIAAQIAFEFFRLNRRLKPVVYGLLVRPQNGDVAAAAASVQRCHRLADIIAQVQEDGTWRHAKDSYLKDRFLFAQFRLAIISRLRAVNYDLQKKVKESIEEIAYSDRLNSLNPSLAKIVKRMDWIKRQNGEDLTPREGLEVAMKRADFVMARRYALPIVREDPDEPNANFALGMSYYAEEQFAKAEEFLRRVMKRNPNEPAVYNNLALVCLKTDRLDEARKFAEKALELKPGQPEIKDTLNQIMKAIEEANDPQRRLQLEMEKRK